MSLPKKMPRGRKSKSQDEGRVFANRYRVEKRLGSGSFGTVYLVEDVKTKGEWKVLKEIFVGELPADETVDAMREARLLSNLNHPNIVKFMDSFIDGEFFCIVTEYCEGGDLDDKIKAWKKAGRTFDESLILAWFIQLAMAIQFMHDKRILHRDLKTRNIFLKNNIVKLGDFGISRILMGTSDMATTFTGTPYYMSPEVLKHEGYKYKSDIWSMGVVLYELCNLEHAFHGESLMGVMYKIVEGNPPSLSDQYSKELKDLYKRMLDKNPVNRPTASEVIRTQYIAKHLTKLKLQMHERLSSSLGSQQQGSKLYDEPEGRPLTPMERVKLKKLQKADEEAEKIKRFMATQSQENQAKYSSHKKSQHRVSLPWVEEHPDVFNDAAFTVNPTDSLLYTPRHVSSLAGAVESSGNRNKESSIHSAAEASLSLTDVSEIPEDADLAETFYSQFDYEFENDESDNDDNFVAGAEDDISDEEGYDEEDELSALMGHMQDALDQSLLGDRTVPEPACESFTDSLRDQRIKGLRAECEKLLGREAFARAYLYLKQVRFVDERRDEDSIMDGLAKIVAKPRDCFLVDQLLFMEKQAEIAAMT